MCEPTWLPARYGGGRFVLIEEPGVRSAIFSVMLERIRTLLIIRYSSASRPRLGIEGASQERKSVAPPVRPHRRFRTGNPEDGDIPVQSLQHVRTAAVSTFAMSDMDRLLIWFMPQAFQRRSWADPLQKLRGAAVLSQRKGL